MNLQGVVGTSRTEAYFWYVCGSTALGIIIVVATYALRHEIKRYLMKRRLELTT
jgi:hypothetical protein